jgi:hypothetical protein
MIRYSLGVNSIIHPNAHKIPSEKNTLIQNKIQGKGVELENSLSPRFGYY